MKTLQYILIAITISITGITQAANNNENTLSIEIIQLNNPSCQGGNNGSALVEAKGGVAPYTYNWNTFPNQFEQFAINLSAGTYFVHVTDAVGNKFYESVLIEDPTYSAVEKPLSSMNDESMVEVIPVEEGPVGPMCMKLNGEVVSSIDYNTLEVGLHKLEIIDGNNCVSSSIIQVFEYERVDPEDLITMKRQEELAQPKVQMVSFANRKK